jgi:iron complex transport system permease protein
MGDKVLQKIIFFSLICSLFVLSFLSILGGRVWLSPPEVIPIITNSMFPGISAHFSPYADLIINIRFPRTIAVLLVGAALSGCGVALQSVYRNPLVSPYILGISTGAGFGAALAILITGNLVLAQASALAFGLFAAALTWGVDRFTQILAGMAMGTLFASLTTLVKWYSDPFTTLPFITFWLFGSFSRVSAEEIIIFGPVLLTGIFLLFCIRWQLNLLSPGYDQPRTMGVDSWKVRGIVLLCTTVIVAVCVSLCGIIGWVGLVIPHIGRLLVGADHLVLLPFSLLGGAAFLLAVDLIIRLIIPGEFPIGVLTGLLGAPVFAILLWRSQKC